MLRLSCRFIAFLFLVVLVGAMPAHAQKLSDVHLAEKRERPATQMRFRLPGVPSTATVRVYEAVALPDTLARRMRQHPDVRWLVDGNVRPAADPAGRATPVLLRANTRATQDAPGVWQATLSAEGAAMLLVETVQQTGSVTWQVARDASNRMGVASNPTLGTTVLVDPATVSTSAGAAEAVVDVQLLDATGVASATFLLTEPGSGNALFGFGTLSSGTNKDGIWKGTVSVPQFTPPGVYTLAVIATSVSGGFASLSTGATLTVTGTGDVEAPRISGAATISPSAINLSGGDVPVTVRVPLADAPAGVATVSVSFEMGEEYVYGGSAVLESGTAQEGVWVLTSAIPQNTLPGTYAVVVYATDHAHNGGEVATGLTLQVSGGDTEAPSLVGVPTVTPGSVNLSSGAARVVVRLRVLDDATGVSFATARFEQGEAYLYPDGEGTLVSGTSTDGTYEVVFEVPRATPEGAWSLVVDLQDEAGNTAEIVTTAQLSVIGSDTTPPTLTSPITRTPANVDLTGGPKTVTVDIPLRDASGVRSVFTSLQLDPSMPGLGAYASLAAGDSLNGVWRAVVEVPWSTLDGMYALTARVEDREGNAAVLAPDLPTPVSGGDRAAPVLGGAVGLSAETVDLTPGAGVLVVTVPVRDAPSGAASVAVALKNSAGDNVFYAAATRTSGTAQEGTWQATFAIPQTTAPGVYALEVIVTDAAYNQAVLTPPQTVTLTIHLPGAPSNPIPADGAAGVPEKPYLAWQPATAATRYDLYLWRDGVPQPIVPAYANVQTPQVAVLDTLEAGARYAWRVVARNGAGTNEGPTWHFTVRRLADLRVVRVEAPATAEAGQHIEVTWTVENAGGAGTSVPRWYDDLYLSTDTTFDAPRSGGAGTVGDVRLLRIPNATALEAGQQYRNRASVLMPRRQFGQLYLIAVTNTGTGGEHEREASEGNNTRFTPINLVLPPASDLEPKALIVPPTVFSGQPFDVRWTVENTGEGSTYTSAWDDIVYLTRDSVLAVGKELAKITYRRILNIKPDSSYTQTYPATLPDSVSGTVWAHLVVDYRDYEFEPGGESNNTLRTRFAAVLTPPADLEAAITQAPSTARSGRTLNVTYTVENAGPGATTTYWSDGVYLAPTPTFDAATAVALETFYNGRGLQAGESYTLEKAVRVPDGLSGTHYLFVMADAGQRVFEDAFETNNVSPGHAVAITLSPSPDLVPVRVEAPPAAVAGERIPVNWTVRNAGAARADALNWRDSVFVSPSQTWDRAQAVYLGLANASDSLRAGASVARSASVPLPVSMAPGTYYVHVVVDAANAVYEHQSEGNNAGRSAPMLVSAYPAIDLAVTAASAPSQAPVGTTVPLTFTVRNTGGGTTVARGWSDEILISEVDSVTSSARLVTSLARLQPVAGGDGYTRTVSIKLPDELAPGAYYLLLHNTLIEGDANRRNNARATPITLSPNPPPDLVVASATTPPTLTAGQPVTLTWKVQNVGDGSTRDTLWHDTAWLSKSADRQSDALRLGTATHQGVLAPGGDYTVSMNPTVPFYATGSYYLVFQTDDQNKVYEALRENNNTRVVPVEVVLPPPSDLVVRDVRVPATATVGEDVEVTYKIENRGANPAYGRMATGVYVSADTAWGVEDPLVQVVEQEVNLAPGASMLVSSTVNLSATVAADSQRVTGPTPGVLPGRYHALVRADLRNNIRESDEGNNLAASTGQATVSVPALILGTPLTRDYARRANHYFRVDVPAGLDLQFTLSRNASRMPGGIYVAYDRMPTTGDYDVAAANASDDVHRLTVPTTKAGTYYVLVRAELIYFDQENFTLLAQALGFSVATLSQQRLGQGLVTTRLTGAGFRPTSRVVLRQGATLVTEATVLDVPSTTEMTVEWNLASVPVGAYALAVLNGAAEAVWSTPVQVEPVVRPRLESVHAAPGALLAARKTEYVFQFRNTGNIDVPFATVLIAVPTGTGVEVESDGRLKTLRDLRHEAGDDDDKPYWFDGQRERFMPMFVRRVAPGEPLEAQVTVVPETPDGPQDFPVRVTVKVEDSATFITEQLQTIEEFRQTALTQQGQIDPQIASLARDRRSFAQYMLDGYRRTGMLSQAEVDDALDRIPDIVPRNSHVIEYGDILKKTCDSIFFVTGCVAAILDCTPELAFIPLTAGASAAMCAFGVTAGCTTALDKASAASGIDLSAAGCIGIASALNCLAKEVVCNKLLLSLDPNDIVGPEGYGDARWVAKSQTLPYTIRFENDAERATAPAQEIRIGLPLDSDLDVRTFRLGSFGFGLLRFDVPANTAFYATRLDVRDSLGVYVDVSAGIDVQNRRAFWSLRAIDPVTGTLPSNPYVGVLAINDSLGRGEGFVNYSVRPNPSTPTGATVQARAIIEFDLNAPIETPPWVNTVDAVAPTSQIAALTEAPEEGRVRLSWSGQDDAEGAGVASYTLYVSENGEAFRPYATDLTDTRYVYPGEPGTAYRFFVLATDHAGNTETVKSEADVVVTRDEAPPELPATFTLEQNFPNPFTTTTTLRYALPRPAVVTLEVFNMLGQRVAVLEADALKPAGWHTARFDGGHLASGVYFYRVHAAAGDAGERWLTTGKMILVR